MTATSTPRTPRSKKPALTTAPADIQATAAPVDLAEHVPTLAYDQPTYRHPLGLLIASPLNPRKHFDEVALKELAESIFHQGLLQNLVARRIDNTQLEVIAGGRRLRALQILQGEGRITGDYLVPVREQDLTDLEALQLATAENAERRSMTALEECDAFAKMLDLGASEEDVAQRFGYQRKAVHQRVSVARSLGEEGREAIEAGTLSYAQAVVVASVPGADLQRSLIANARHSSAQHLAQLITQGNMLVKHAQFPLEQYTGQITRDLFDAYPAYFSDKKQALDLQTKHARAMAKKDQEQGAVFSDVVLNKDGYFSWYGSGYDIRVKDKKRAGTVYLIDTRTGELVRHEHIAKVVPRTSSPNEPAQKGPRPIPESTYLDAHHYRARALRGALLGDTNRALVLTVHSLILDSNAYHQRAGAGIRLVRDVPHSAETMPPEITEALGVLQGKLAPAAPREKKGAAVAVSYLTVGEVPDDGPLWTLLSSWSQEELLMALSTMVSAVTYDWSAYSMAGTLPLPLFARIAGEVNAHERLAQDFRLTDVWLKRYPRDHLLALAKEAKLDAEQLTGLKTAKEIRGQILEHADRLHAEGFVPKLVQFPTA